MFKYYKCYISIELTFLKAMMLVKQVHQKNVIFVVMGFFLNKGFKFQPNFHNRIHDLSMMSMNLSDIIILNIKSDDYGCVISAITKMRLQTKCKMLI